MKWMIASDIHGSAYYCKQMVEAYRREKADRLLLLGICFITAPEMTSRGTMRPNRSLPCSTSFPGTFCVYVETVTPRWIKWCWISRFLQITYSLPPQGRIIFATHGHRYNEADLPKIKHGDILLNGHTHVPACDQHGHYTYLNPGSVSIPKEGSPNSYLTLEDGAFLWKTLEGTVWKEFTIAP